MLGRGAVGAWRVAEAKAKAKAATPSAMAGGIRGEANLQKRERARGHGGAAAGHVSGAHIGGLPAFPLPLRLSRSPKFANGFEFGRPPPQLALVKKY